MQQLYDILQKFKKYKTILQFTFFECSPCKYPLSWGRN